MTVFQRYDRAIFMHKALNNNMISVNGYTAQQPWPTHARLKVYFYSIFRLITHGNRNYKIKTKPIIRAEYRHV